VLKRLRIKFVVMSMVIVTVMLCAILGLIYHFTQQGMEIEDLNMMRTAAAVPLKPGGRLTAPKELRQPYLVLWFGRNGETACIGDEIIDLEDEQDIVELAQAALAENVESGILKDCGLRFFIADAPDGRRIVFSDVSGELATLRNLRSTCFFILIVGFLAFLGISLALASWAVGPVDRAWKQQKQFISDASHDLKTPLTVIMTNAELLQNPEYDEDSRRSFTENILTMSRQMRSLIERMLELARTDNGLSASQLKELDLSKLTNDTILPFEPVFFERGLEFSTEVEEGIHVKGNAAQLCRAIEILLDNAQKYALPNGSAHLSLKRSGHRRCMLRVSNDGEPISKEDLKNIFKRFYRTEEARSSDGSFGLGLSIAEGIAKAHGGRLWGESRNGVNSFLMELPIL